MSDSATPVCITMSELLVWNSEASSFWKRHFDANPDLLQLPCGIGGAATVQDLVRHIWGAELRWAERLAGVPETPRDALPIGPLAALFAIREKAAPIYTRLLADPQQDWDAPYTFHLASLPDGKMILTRRKVLAHALFHGQRHWAQLATLVRAAGFPSGFYGDILFSSALE
jgi:uncharacterized damage-inducible protein DinB